MAVLAEPRAERRRVPIPAAVALPVLAVVAVLALWELAPRVGLVREESIPPFSTVMGAVGTTLGDPDFWSNLAASAGRWALGFALAIVIGVSAGVLMGRSRALFHLVDPLLTVTYPVPKAALILLFVLWWGAGQLSRVAIIVTGCLIPIVISAYHGARGVEPRLVWSARGLGVSRARTLHKVVLPAALPQVLNGLRVAIAISIFTLLASELLIRKSGVGAYMFTFLDNGQNLRVWAMSVIIALIGFGLDFLYVQLVRRGLRWMDAEV
jgi:NitT/TauT family transport system permease protein